MTTADVLTLLFGVVLGAVCAWLVLRSRVQSQDATGRADLADTRAAMERAVAETATARAETNQVRAELAGVRALVESGRADLAQAQAERAETESALSEMRARASEAQSKLAGVVAERDAAIKRADEIAADHERMAHQFKALSAEQLEHQNKLANEAAAERQKQVDAIVAPLAQQLKDFQTRLTEMEKERVTISTELREQVKLVTMTGDQVRRETHALATALRKPQVRGQWGEMQLKRVVEVAGMVEHCHFTTQGTTTTTADTTIRPDLTVMLGEDKFVHVDSKVPLAAFLEAEEAESTTDRERLMGQFTRNVRTHVDQLSAKQYWKSEAGTPEFVVMFIPSEALAAEALNRMPDLMAYASDKGILLTTPSSLIGLLKTVAFSWRQAAVAENARQVFDQARELYERLSTLGGHVEKLGRALGSAVKAYNVSVGSLEGRVLPAARKLKDLDVSGLELPSPSPVEVDVRQLRAPELVESFTLPEKQELTRGEPTLDDLLDDAPASSPAGSQHLRRLG